MDKQARPKGMTYIVINILFVILLMVPAIILAVKLDHANAARDQAWQDFFDEYQCSCLRAELLHLNQTVDYPAWVENMTRLDR